jgi:carotenoid 1,2-hydratase
MEGGVQPGEFSQLDPRPLSCGGQHTPGSGSADGRDLRSARGSLPQGGLRFDREVPSGGYAWWYLDGLSADGTHGITVIAFVGSVFSPYYALARRHGAADPLDHCALNVALYGPRSHRWAMRERGALSVLRSASSLSIRTSSMEWDGTRLSVAIDERCAPIPWRLKGTIRLWPEAIADGGFGLDPTGLHRWTPYAPCARVEVSLDDPDLSWCGNGYFDSNCGDEPLEDGFERWNWSRTGLSGGDTVVFYDMIRRDSTPAALALKFTPRGEIHRLDAPPLVTLAPTRWGVARATRCEENGAVRILKTLEDSPFYSRSLLDTGLSGARGLAIHESLNLERFRAAWVRCLLPFRMPRFGR